MLQRKFCGSKATVPLKRVRFVSAARCEFLAQAIYYNEEEPDLGARFTVAVKDGYRSSPCFPTFRFIRN